MSKTHVKSAGYRPLLPELFSPGPGTAPLTETDLLLRARDLSGRTIGEIARERGVDAPDNLRREKGFVGTLIERALGIAPSSRGGPDVAELGIEIKTVPVDRKGQPRESTFVCTIPLSRIGDLEWADSPAWHKLRRVLWIPIESEDNVALVDRRVGTAVLWSPSREEAAALRADWDELAGLIGTGAIESLTGHIGQCLQVRPKGANATARTRAPEPDGGFLLTMPRAFYLRTSFTARVFASLAVASPRRTEAAAP